MTPADDEAHLVELRDHLGREQQRLVELGRRAEAATARAEILRARIISDRLSAADQAELLADQAEAFAAHLEAGAVGPARNHRLKLAQREREIAAVERRNAARLREAGVRPLRLEFLPPLDDDRRSI